MAWVHCSVLTTLRRLLLLAVIALSAGDLETRHDPVAFAQVLDARAHLVDDAAELVAEDVALLQLDDGAVVQVQVAATDGAAGDFEDHIPVFEDLGFGAVDCLGKRVLVDFVLGYLIGLPGLALIKVVFLGERYIRLLAGT